MLYCQSSPEHHRAAAVYAMTLSRACGHESPVRLLACLQHGAQWRAGQPPVPPSACERCGEQSVPALARIEDVFEERVVVTILRVTLERSALSPMTFAHDSAYRLVEARGLEPVRSHRLPVEWQSGPGGGYEGDLVSACVTLAVTLPEPRAARAG